MPCSILVRVPSFSQICSLMCHMLSWTLLLKVSRSGMSFFLMESNFMR